MNLTKPRQSSIKISIQLLEGSKYVKGQSKYIMVYDTDTTDVYDIVYSALKETEKERKAHDY